jgi:zinc protease
MVRVLCFCLLFLSVSFAKADILPIESMKTPKGIDIWLVEDHSSPVVSLVISFDKTKLSSPHNPLPVLLQIALSEGAGHLTPLQAKRFALETPASFQFNFGFSKNTLTIKTIRNGIGSALKTISQFIGTPQFQKADLNHSKKQTLTVLSAFKEDLPAISSLNLLKTIIPQMPLVTDFEKSLEVVQSVTAQDLEKENKEQFLSSPPKIVVVGDITKKEIVEIIDSTFGMLSLQSSTNEFPTYQTNWKTKEVYVDKDVPQTVVSFGQPGVSPQSKDYPKFLLLRNILASRFFDEIREKRGLIYGISFWMNHYKDINLLTGEFSCRCCNAERVVKFIRTEWEKLKEFGVLQKELSDAKLGFKRSHILNLTSTEAVAVTYADFQIFNLGTNAAKTLFEQTDKITLEDMNQFVRDLLKPEALTFAIIGPSPNQKENHELHPIP